MVKPSKLLFGFLIAFSSFLATGQTAPSGPFKNLNLQQACEDSPTGICFWQQSWGGKDAIRLDPNGSDSRSMLIEGKAENSVGFSEQAADLVPGGEGVIVTLSARIRSRSVEGKGAGLNIGVYDKNDKLIATKDMGGFYSLDWVSGTSDGREYSISIVSPPEAVKVKIGAILYGKGTAVFSDFKATVTPIGKRKASRLAADYIDEAARVIKRHSLFRDSINIADLERTALKIAGPAKTYRECYLAVEFMLESLRPLGDEHSFLMKAAEVKNWKKGGSLVNKVEDPQVRKMDRFGYILVPPFHSGDKKQMLEYADHLQLGIRDLASQGLAGWIVDLRQNTGGNMAPMIAGLGPLFSATKLGSLIDVNGRPNSWHYDRGRYFWDDDNGWRVTDPTKLVKALPTAVLIGDRTGSSGEAVVVSFLQNDNTRTFGCPTWGLTTGNADFTLKDGAQIYLASTVMADRKGNRYETRIAPDQPVEGCRDADVTAAAVKWLTTVDVK